MCIFIINLLLIYKMSSKNCKVCNEEKNISEFYSQRRECKSCMNKKRRKNIELCGTKICVRCEEEKDIQRFRPTRNVCKDCTNQDRKTYMKGYYEENKKEWKDKERQRNQKKIEELDDNKTKECKDCKEDKTVKEFRLNRNRCLDCERKVNRDYVLDKRQNDPVYKFMSNCRTRLIQVIKKEYKMLNTIEYLGQNIDFIKKWIEFCFSNDMNWDNQGSFWHIDHVVPVSRFNLETEEDVIKCFNWKNLTPLTAKENLTKSSNIIPLQIQEHVKKLRLFISTYDTDKQNDVEEYISNVFLPHLTNNNLRNTLLLETPKDLTTTLC